MRLEGSLMNRIAENYRQPLPKTGMGATILMYTDRHAATVVQIVTPFEIIIQEDTATRTDKNGMSECQQYAYTPNLEAVRLRVRKNRLGQWKIVKNQPLGGTVVSLGERDHYHDYSF